MDRSKVVNPLNALKHDKLAILLISEACDALGTLLYALDRHDLRCLRLPTLEAGLARAAEGGIGLILLDAKLAGADLAATCRRLAGAAADTVAPPLYLLSAHPSAEEQGRSVGAGAADYLKLPLDGHAVAEKILMELALRRAVPARLQAGAVHPQTLEVNHHALLAGASDCLLLYDADNERIVDANHHAERLFGLSAAALLQMSLASLCPPRQPDGRLSGDAVTSVLRLALGGNSEAADISFRRAGAARGSAVCEVRMLLLPVPDRHLLQVRIVDLSASRRDEALRQGQNFLLEMIARGDTLGATLDGLMRLIEAQSEGVFCAVLLLAPDGVHIAHALGPSMPRSYLASLEGLAIGPAVGSCGTAMYRKETVIVSDLLTDPLWEPYRAVAHQHGLRACWSLPIMTGSVVLGSFAMYYRTVRRPTPAEVRLIGAAGHLAGIAIERPRREQELQEHRDHLEDLVAERTAALTLAKEQSEQDRVKLAAALQDLRLTQQHLLRRDKLAALGTLVAGVAHELNTPIGNSLVVAGKIAERTQQLQDHLGAGLRRSELASYLDAAAEADQIMLRNLQRAANLVSSFKQIAVDHGSSQRRQFALDQLVAEWLQPFAAVFKHSGFALEQAIPPDLLMDSYPGPLGQVLTSLLDNCLQHGFARRGSGTVRIAAAAAGDGTLALSVADNGIGIPAASLAHIYDPFFTTRPGGGGDDTRGAGLGLHIVHNIVTGVLGGSIDVASGTDGAAGTPGGTVFTLTLPLVAPAPAQAAEAATATATTA